MDEFLDVYALHQPLESFEPHMKPKIMSIISDSAVKKIVAEPPDSFYLPSSTQL
jgi:hypothetical protein